MATISERYESVKQHLADIRDKFVEWQLAKSNRKEGMRQRSAQIKEHEAALDNLCREGPDEDDVVGTERDRHNEDKLRRLQKLQLRIDRLEEARTAFDEQMKDEINNLEVQLEELITGQIPLFDGASND